MSANDLSGRYAQTRTRIASAATRCGRAAESVGLVAISKGQPAAAVRQVAELGQRDFGENYLQEAIPKMQELEDLRLTWHFTGQVQANKTRLIASHFDWIHTLDRERIAARLSEQRSAHLPPINVCIQVQLEAEEGKGGIKPEELADLAGRIRALPRLRLRGLMTLPPPRDAFDAQKAVFDRLAALLRELNVSGFDLDTLSMGMSADVEAAVAAGATLVRIGTGVFGERKKG